MSEEESVKQSIIDEAQAQALNEETNPNIEPQTSSEISIDENLDRTSVINEQGIKSEFEKTKLHGDIELNDTIENTARTKLDSTDKDIKEPKKKSKIFLTLKNLFKKNNQNKKESGFDGIVRFLNYFFWIGLGLCLFTILIYSAYLSSQYDLKYAIIIGASSIMTFLIGVLALIKKWPPYTFFSFLGFCFFALFSIYIFRYGLNSSEHLGVLNYFWDQIFVILFLEIIFLELIFILFHAPKKIVLKFLLLLPLIYGASGFIYYFYHGYSLAMGWAEIEYYLPFSVPQNLLNYIHPIWILMQPYIHIVVLSSLLGLFLGKTQLFRKIYFSRLLLFLSIFTLSTFVLQNIRISNPISWLKGYESLIGKIQVEEQGRQFELSTYPRDGVIFSDFIKRFQLHILDLELNQEGESEYYISASSIDDLPIYHLNKEDLNLTIDGQKIKKWDLESLSINHSKLKELDFNKESFYKITLPTQKAYPSFSFHELGNGFTFSQDESVHFSLDQKSPVVKKVVVYVDGEEKKVFSPEPYKRFFSFPFDGISPGEHQLKVQMFGVDDLEISKDQKLSIIPKQTARLLIPSSNEIFENRLEVLIELPDYYPVYQTKLLLKINGDVKKELNQPPYRTSIDTSLLEDGAYSFQVDIIKQEGNFDSQWKKVDEISIPILKANQPQISFEIPTIGEFLDIESLFKINISDEKFDRVELHHDKDVIYEWKSKPFMTNINTSSLESVDQLYMAKAFNEDGMVVSTWNEVGLGRGRLQLVLSNKMDKSFNPFLKRVIFILDASMSMNDIWDGRSKWFWSSVIFSLPELTQLFDQMDMGVMALGANQSSIFNSCQDYISLSKDLVFDSNEILTNAYKVSPKGIFGLYDNLDKALQIRPDKIIIISDGADACHDRVPKSLVSKLKRKKVDINYIGLGPLSAESEKKIDRFKKIDNVTFKEVKSGSELTEYLTDLLAVNYELHLNGEVIFKAPIDTQERLVRSGEYDLVIPSFPELGINKIRVYNGITSRFEIKNNGNKLEMKKSL